MRDLNRTSSQPVNPRDAFVSIVIPVRNEADSISTCLEAVLAQDYPLDRMEIIVADGMSTDKTGEIVASFAQKHPDLRWIDNPSRIVPTALNLAIAEARGDIVIRVDGHCEIAADYVSRCVRHLLDDQVGGVGGPIDTVGTSWISKAIACAMSSSFGVGNSAFRTVSDRTMLVDTVAFPAYTRDTMEMVGPYDEELVRDQDDEYNYRLRELGGKVLLTSDIRSRYYSRSSIPLLARQYFQYGFWKVRVMQKHPRQMRLRQFVPPLFVATLLVLASLSLFVRVVRVVLRLVTVTYLASNIAASLWVATKHGWRHLPLLPLVFGVLHVSYGLGFLAGLVKFWNRWVDRGTSARAFAPQTQWQKAAKSGSN